MRQKMPPMKMSTYMVNCGLKVAYTDIYTGGKAWHIEAD